MPRYKKHKKFKPKKSNDLITTIDQHAINLENWSGKIAGLCGAIENVNKYSWLIGYTVGLMSENSCPNINKKIITIVFIASLIKPLSELAKTAAMTTRSILAPKLKLGNRIKQTIEQLKIKPKTIDQTQKFITTTGYLCSYMSLITKCAAQTGTYIIPNITVAGNVKSVLLSCSVVFDSIRNISNKTNLGIKVTKPIKPIINLYKSRSKSKVNTTNYKSKKPSK